jgi:hypothetical protein
MERTVDEAEDVFAVLYRMQIRCPQIRSRLIPVGQAWWMDYARWTN